MQHVKPASNYESIDYIFLKRPGEVREQNSGGGNKKAAAPEGAAAMNKNYVETETVD